eukprot:2272801-Pyramimonas_sp.AAC.1
MASWKATQRRPRAQCPARRTRAPMAFSIRARRAAQRAPRFRAECQGPTHRHCTVLRDKAPRRFTPKRDSAPTAAHSRVRRALK